MPRVHVPDDFAHDPSAFVWSHYAPEIAGGASGYIQAVYTKSLLSLRELEAARMRTAQINGCELCIGMRSDRDLGAFLEGIVDKNVQLAKRCLGLRDDILPSIF